MQSSHIVIFSESQPFEPFRLFLSDGRVLDVLHPEITMLADHALGVWVFHQNGEVELIDGDSITAMRTLGPVDPKTFIPQRPPRNEE